MCLLLHHSSLLLLSRSLDNKLHKNVHVCVPAVSEQLIIYRVEELFCRDLLTSSHVVRTGITETHAELAQLTVLQVIQNQALMYPV